MPLVAIGVALAIFSEGSSGRWPVGAPTHRALVEIGRGRTRNCRPERPAPRGRPLSRDPLPRRAPRAPRQPSKVPTPI